MGQDRLGQPEMRVEQKGADHWRKVAHEVHLHLDSALVVGSFRADELLKVGEVVQRADHEEAVRAGYALQATDLAGVENAELSRAHAGSPCVITGRIRAATRPGSCHPDQPWRSVRGDEGPRRR